MGGPHLHDARLLGDARAKLRWPSIGILGLLAVLFVWTFFFDFVIEGLFLMPMGLFTYPGAIQWLSIYPGTYYQWPIYEGLMWGGVQAGLCCSASSRTTAAGPSSSAAWNASRAGFVKQQSTRFLAIFAACSLFFFVFYNVPAQWFALHADPWPEDIQKRSYFTMGICGEGTGRLCPHPALPIEQTTSAYIAPDGKVVLPEGTELPKIVPFDRAE